MKGLSWIGARGAFLILPGRACVTFGSGEAHPALGEGEWRPEAPGLRPLNEPPQKDSATASPSQRHYPATLPVSARLRGPRLAPQPNLSPIWYGLGTARAMTRPRNTTAGNRHGSTTAYWEQIALTGSRLASDRRPAAPCPPCPERCSKDLCPRRSGVWPLRAVSRSGAARLSSANRTGP